jgi:4-hydroxy-tetrahydrodipicolinate synthase
MTLTALITPFTAEAEIDWQSLENLLHFQLSSKIDGIIGLCTTSETPSLTIEEQLEIASFILNINQEYKKKIYFGLAGSSTLAVKSDMKRFQNLDFNGFLISTPSYNKPPQAGLIKHFLELDKVCDREIILYNVPGRTSVNLEPASVIEILKGSQNVVAIKEACGDLSQIRKVIQMANNNGFSDFQVLSGDDALTVDIILSGGTGVVSVASNLYPNEIAKMVNLVNTDIKTARILEARFSQFFSDCFIQTNPIPIKHFLFNQNIIKTDQVRLPLISFTELMETNKISAKLNSLSILSL